MSAVHFTAFIPKTQTNQNPISKKKKKETPLKESLSQANWEVLILVQ